MVARIQINLHATLPPRSSPVVIHKQFAIEKQTYPCVCPKVAVCVCVCARARAPKSELDGPVQGVMGCHWCYVCAIGKPSQTPQLPLDKLPINTELYARSSKHTHGPSRADEQQNL